MQLEEFQDIDEQLALMVVNSLQAVQDSHKEFITKIVDHPSKQDDVDCTNVNDRVKDQVEEVKQQYEDFKTKTTEYTASS